MKRLLFITLLLTCAASAQTWPGKPGNTVGYQGYSGWTGSFNASACGSGTNGSSWATATKISNCTYTAASTTLSCNWCIFELVDFKTTNNTQITGTHMLFIGDRFQSNDVNATNVGVTGSDIHIIFSSTTPLASLTASPPGSSWPSAGAGANSTTMTSGVNDTPFANSYEFGFNLFNSGPVYIDSCDVWGYGDAIIFPSSNTQQITITNTWMHDPSDPNGSTYHIDGPGYSNGAAGPSNITLVGNTIAMLGNTNALAMQAMTTAGNNVIAANNFFSGDNATIAFSRSLSLTNSAFYGNTFGTDVMDFGIADSGNGLGSGSVWACNTIEFLAGTTWTNLGGYTPVSGDNGKYIYLTTNTANATDYLSNTFCGIPNPASLEFGNQGTSTSSASKTITFSSTNTGNLSSISASLVTGTQFSITSNTCGSTLNSGSNCTIGVKFAPTGLGPAIDTLQITDNTPGVTSPQLVPLAGVGVVQTQASAPSCSPGSGTSGTSITVTCTNSNAGTTIMCYTLNGATPVSNLAGTACTTGTALSGASNTILINSTVTTLNVIAGTSTFTDSTVSSYGTYSIASVGMGINGAKITGLATH